MATQGNGQKWPLCTGDRYRQVGYNMRSILGTIKRKCCQIRQDANPDT